MSCAWNKTVGDPEIFSDYVLVVTTRTVILFYFSLHQPSLAVVASSSLSETMKAACSLDNPKVNSFFSLHYIQCATEKNFMIIW